MRQPVFSALDLARFLGDPHRPPMLPTEDQQAVIEHPVGDAVLVVAGAGSGKTETIANRVLWLIVNGLVEPREVLGLTFTRKAAGELGERLRGKLFAVLERAQASSMLAQLSDAQRNRITRLNSQLDDSLDLPEASTYNAFAVSVTQEFGSILGSADALIDEATAWGLARDVVVASTDPELQAIDASIDRLTVALLRIARSSREHLVTIDRVIDEAERFLTCEDLPRDERARARGVRGNPYADVRDVLPSVRLTKVAARLAKEYERRKQERGLLEYSDQVALAIETLDHSPEAVSTLRARHRVIFLDEMQDTSVAQTRLLSHVFRGCSVMAVGDPHQSIYGWRGASSESLSGFHRAFQGPGAKPASVLSLSTSWRNARRILDAANVIAAPLRAQSPIHVPKLQPAAEAEPGTVTAHYAETIDEEIQTVAAWMKAERERYEDTHGSLPTAAILFRSRKHMVRFSRGLTEAGVPNRIVGIGGLLTTPEVTDIVATLRCLWDAEAGNELIRLLAGPRFAVGPADIRGLRDLADWLSLRDHAHRPLRPETLASTGPLDEQRMRVTLVDALDVLLRLPDDHGALKQVTPVGRTRLREAAGVLRKLRSMLGTSIPDLIGQVVRELRLDMELASNERWTPETSANAAANMYAFTEEVRRFLEISDDQGLGAVLAWLSRTEQEDEFVSYVPPARPDAVQLTTVHSAKGLEWDIVAIPNLSEGSFPSAPRNLGGWLSGGVLPDRLRGDASTRPKLSWDLAATSKELKDRIAEYREQNRQVHAEEERRLVYVAVTRARSRLLLTGSFWRGGRTPSAPAEHLRDLVEAGCIDAIPLESASRTPPDGVEEQRIVWPQDPLGARRDRVTSAAEAVRTARASLGSSDQLGSVSRVLLAKEQRPADARRDALEAWTRVNASQFHEFVADPEGQLTNLVRPLPQRPFRRTRLGNLFHSWVEQRTTTARGTALELDVGQLHEGGDDISPEEQRALDELIAVFERSPWATLRPILVEEEISLPFAGRRIVCKLDAVYERQGRIEIVDWKTGRMPTGREEQTERFLQLDLYRVAYSMTFDVPLEQIDATLFYVRDNHTLTSRRVRTLEELESLWKQALARARNS